MGGRRLVHAIVLMYTLRLPPSRTSPSLPASLPHSGVMSSESRGGRACSRRASAHRSLTKVIQRGGDVDACDPASTGSGAQLGQEDPAGMRIGEMAHCHFGSTAGRPTSCASRRAASHWSLVTAAILACQLPLASKLKTQRFTARPIPMNQLITSPHDMGVPVFASCIALVTCVLSVCYCCCTVTIEQLTFLCTFCKFLSGQTKLRTLCCQNASET
jgi:hypothetical protein